MIKDIIMRKYGAPPEVVELIRQRDRGAGG
jgi:hypothetical protein